MNWYDDHDELVTLAYWLDMRGEFRTAADVLTFVEKPWNWSESREQMVREERDAA